MRRLRAITAAARTAESALKGAVKAHRAEIERRDRTIALLQTKVELVQREATDRVFEALKLPGIGYGAQPLDLEIARLRLDDKTNDNNGRAGNDLAPHDKDTYDEAYQSHVRRGRAMGYDDAQIEGIWRQNEERILQVMS